MKDYKFFIIDIWSRLSSIIISIATIIALYYNDINIARPAVAGSICSLLPSILLQLLYNFVVEVNKHD